MLYIKYVLKAVHTLIKIVLTITTNDDNTVHTDCLYKMINCMYETTNAQKGLFLFRKNHYFWKYLKNAGHIVNFLK